MRSWAGDWRVWTFLLTIVGNSATLCSVGRARGGVVEGLVGNSPDNCGSEVANGSQDECDAREDPDGPHVEAKEYPTADRGPYSRDVLS